MTPYNRNLIESVVAMIDRFVEGEEGISDMQSKFQSVIGIFDREPDSPEGMMRVAEADLEEIQFARLLEEQRPAAVFLLDELRAKLEKALARPE